MNKLDEDQPYFQASSRMPLNAIVLFRGKELMAWTTKALPHPTLAGNIMMAVVFSLLVGVILYEYFTGLPAVTESSVTDLAILGICIWLFFWKKVVLQKNVYKMRITEVGGQANYWADIPENINIFFRWTVGIGIFLVVCLIAVMPSGIWLLAGPGGVAVLASKSLLNWKRVVRYNDFKWEELDWVVIDRKRKLVVFTAHWDPSRTFEEQYVCFEAFVPKDQIDDLIRIAKFHAPTCTHFEQCHWDGCNE
ncbi:hypothetical protein QN386_16095 [Pseudomonas sp. CCI3.2]|uniref:hypothetical protein n=1 Tax=unclassified Pseudomonas TaxID=196821 RepID=UPI002AC9C789|nr:MULTISPECIES: hypothetical protein [unclassified Pseudomonas]MEB0077866.1 hypothetical protein [Pseudomonas sp. MH10out]MEB0102836.1 hypothetical protein [Pseudomonas sp. CCI3.2]MEB0131686.1 hypothetical protein [Pseudomonas sp. CCI2.4]MEB0159531.1 hypothetical protein [Pseudomonas sp. AH2 (2023)]MEB0169746.1 hypothetical protein [Pseudomonas sp. CCC4.4]